MKKSMKKIRFFCLCFTFILMAGTGGIYAQSTGTINIFGDVNGDQVVDIVDALLVAQAFVGLYPDSFNENTADVNIDLTIDIVDALLIAQYYVGLITIVPGEERYAEYQKMLTTSRESWLSLGVSHYEYIFEKYCFCPDAGIQFLIEVDQDSIVSVTDLGDGTILPEDQYGSYITIMNLLDRIQTVIDEKSHIMELEFHETYSYPTVISVDQLILAIDDEYTYNMSGFRSLTNIRIVPVSSNTQQGDPFGLQSAQVTGDILTLTIDFSGGCMDHAVSVSASDAFMESYPPQVDCYINHEDPGDPCDAIVLHTEGFNLMPLAELYKSMYHSTGTLILNLYSFDGRQLQLEYIIR